MVSTEELTDMYNKDKQGLYSVLLDNLSALQFGAFMENLRGTDVNLGQYYFDDLADFINDIELLSNHEYDKTLHVVYTAMADYGKHNGLNIDSALLL